MELLQRRTIAVFLYQAATNHFFLFHKYFIHSTIPVFCLPAHTYYFPVLPSGINMVDVMPLALSFTYHLSLVTTRHNHHGYSVEKNPMRRKENAMACYKFYILYVRTHISASFFSFFFSCFQPVKAASTAPY